MDTYFVGIDIGSTTIKFYMINQNNECVYQSYVRHHSNIRQALKDEVENVKAKFGHIHLIPIITGSGGLGLSKDLNIEFVQEVIACTKAIETYIPQCDVAIELGGEDAKITYLNGTLEQRMNGTCAGGTGAFIDQMATLLKTDAQGLNALAKGHTCIYPIASRCGVFAKSDIQPLINEGARKEDIAASIFQAIVNQTISGLACGKPIRGKIAFLGGPLYFLDSLRERFIDTLHLQEDEVIFPKNSQLFVAIGACLYAKEKDHSISLDDLYKRLSHLSTTTNSEQNRLNPLFENDADYKKFQHRHQNGLIKTNDLYTYQGNAYLGIDVGSTTTKMVLIGADQSILYTFYDSNRGNPLDLVIEQLKYIHTILPAKCTIQKVGVTGYGEAFIQHAIQADYGEVETIAHFQAARHFCKDVSFILDIGGQDMKAMSIQDGVIQDIILNEACSSGCGSFLETFAHSLGYTIEEFANLALQAKAPLDLGSRCTVFMNSKVKQAQKEGASIEDISAGLSYSIIKNALYKVIKLKNKEQLGQHILVQGGTFYNDAVLRAFELETGIEVIRPSISGLMGAYGIALIALEKDDGLGTHLLDYEQLLHFTYQNKMHRCAGCTNHCLLTTITFNDGRHFISGNRCEKGANLKKAHPDLPNLYQYKYHRIFDYPQNQFDDAKATVGIPRVLNMYENYPFWHAFFSSLHFNVVLSAQSSKQIYEKGMESIPSENVCYPAKLVHGHIEDLIEKQVDLIFYPAILYERVEDPTNANHYNCPVVAGYSETIRNNLDHLDHPDSKYIPFLNPFLSLNNPKTMANVLFETLADYGISKHEIQHAIEVGFESLDQYHHDIHQQGKLALDYMKEHHSKGIVLAGRPYHVDPEINHGLDKLISAEGFVLLSEDSIYHLDQEELDLRVVNQWTYHSRLYHAANVVSNHKDLELVQLTSFGCGLDAITSDQVQEILKMHHKIYTLIKIDEVSNLGAIRIRIRSLKATLEKMTNTNQPSDHDAIEHPRPIFTKEMKEQHYTILCPQMSPIHFQFIEEAMNASGYRFEVLPSIDKNAIEEGLKYVNNDACYPCILVVGQMMNALKSGQYDLNKVALMITQTGGGCRATNYISLIRKALQDAHLEHIPVISVSLKGIETNPGFKITFPLAKRLVMAGLYGDLLMRVLYRVRPYEKEKGSANALYDKWVAHCKQNIDTLNILEFKHNVHQIVNEFDTLELLNITKPKVGLVGEILVKFHPTANNNIVKTIEEEGGEAVMPDLVDFFLYCFYNAYFKESNFEGRHISTTIARAGIDLVELFRKDIVKELNASKRFTAPQKIDHIAKQASPIVSLGNQTGEGWFLTGEMLELIESGCMNIVCMQPFACLPNHITGKGVIKAIKKKYPTSNIVAIDYDPGASEVNQLNRIKLMFASAKRNDTIQNEKTMDIEPFNDASILEKRIIKVENISHKWVM